MRDKDTIPCPRVLQQRRHAGQDPVARLVRRTGYVSRSWAEREHSRGRSKDRDSGAADRTHGV
jgi:formate dehydrogenase subunit gamma